ncbi:hypothetical protein GCM10027403_33800 [Arthrobacter tecti]
MGTFTSVPGPTRIVRISDIAWALALDAAGTTFAAHDSDNIAANTPSATAALPQETVNLAWAELRTAGIARGDAITDAWLGVINLILFPGTLVRMTAEYNGLSGQSELSITGSRGACVYRRRTIESLPNGGTRITGREPAVEISLFNAAQFWGSAVRVLPPVEELRADAANARDVTGETPVVVPREVSAAIATHLQQKSDDDGGLAAALPGLDVPAELTDVVVHQTASVTATMETRAGGRVLTWAGMWSFADDQLYVIRTRADEGAVTLTRVQPGHVARELSFALVGAYDFAGSAQGARA